MVLTRGPSPPDQCNGESFCFLRWRYSSIWNIRFLCKIDYSAKVFSKSFLARTQCLSSPSPTVVCKIRVSVLY